MWRGGRGVRGCTGLGAGWDIRHARIAATQCPDPSVPAPAVGEGMTWLRQAAYNLDHVVVVMEFLDHRFDRMKEGLGTRVIHNNPQNFSAVPASRVE
jgi:hypothetical protein